MVIQFNSMADLNPVCPSRFQLTNPSKFAAQSSVNFYLNCSPCVIPVIPTCGPQLGRVVYQTDPGGGSFYTTSLPGGAAVSGTWLVALIADDSTGAATFQGASLTGWTKILGIENFNNMSANLWYKLCGSSEPTGYDVTSTGNGSVCTIMEILGGNATNPDGTGTASLTAIAPSATSSTSCGFAVTGVIDVSTTTPFTPPTGYTTAVAASYGIGTNLFCNLSYESAVGTGTISPGGWGSAETSHDYLWTLIFK